VIGPDEWESICLLVEEGWPGEFTDSAASAWRVFLDDYESAQVLAALKAMVARGGTFRPSVAQVVAEMRRDPSKPTFDEALVLIRRALRAGRRPLTGSYDNEAQMLGAREELVREAALGMHQSVASFVGRCSDIGRLEDEISELSGGEYAGARRRDLERRWEAHLEAFEGREISALAAGRRDGLRQLDPLGALGISAPKLLDDPTERGSS
jgi:hypothetical protein